MRREPLTTASFQQELKNEMTNFSSHPNKQVSSKSASIIGENSRNYFPEEVNMSTEFKCTAPDFNKSIDVLAYDLTKEQSRILNKLSHNVYNFQRYALSNSIKTVWVCPIFDYGYKEIPSKDFYYKMGLIFERFEMLKNQSDIWQNLLVKFWIEDVTSEKIDVYSEKFHINPKIFCKNPYKKTVIERDNQFVSVFGQTGA